MKMHDGIIFLDKVQTFFPTMNSVEYTDIDNNRIVVPIDVLIRLYEGARYHLEAAYGIDFDEFSEDVLGPSHQFGQ